MTFSFGPKGGIQDPEILRLLAELTKKIKAHGLHSDETQKFITKNEYAIVVDQLSQEMHTFRELAEAIGPLIQGLRNPSLEEEEEKDPADWWKRGS